MIYAFAVDATLISDTNGIYGGMLKVQLPVQDGARIAWDVVGADYQIEFMEAEYQTLGWGDSGAVAGTVGVNAGLFMTDQGNIEASGGGARVINFGLDNPTLIDAYSSQIIIPSFVEKVSS